jgi:hypothetical protein
MKRVKCIGQGARYPKLPGFTEATMFQIQVFLWRQQVLIKNLTMNCCSKTTGPKLHITLTEDVSRGADLFVWSLFNYLKMIAILELKAAHL